MRQQQEYEEKLTIELLRASGYWKEKDDNYPGG
jgi:hypothetical protein